MKKLNLFFVLATMFVATFSLTSCTLGSSEPEYKVDMTEPLFWVRDPSKDYLEEGMKIITQKTKSVTAISGDDLWTIGNECGGNPRLWDTIVQMNPYLYDRVQFQDKGDGLGFRPWVWIFPGEEILVPENFSCSRLRVVEKDIETKYYFPTTDSLVLYSKEPKEGYRATGIILPESIAADGSPKFIDHEYGKYQSSLPVWFWNIGETLLALIALAILMIILGYILSWLIGLLRGSSRRDNRTDEDIENHSQTVSTPFLNSFRDMGAMEKMLLALQKTGGFIEADAGKTNMYVPTQPQPNTSGGKELSGITIFVSNEVSFNELQKKKGKDKK